MPHEPLHVAMTSMFAMTALAGCGSGPIGSDGGTTTQSSAGESTESTDTGEAPFEPTPEQLAEIAALDEELMTIVEGAIAHFLASHPVGPEPGSTEHFCPYPNGQPAGGEAGITPDIGLNCNEGPSGLCEPEAGGGGGGVYDSALWELNSVWSGVGFAKTEPHSFHYNLIAINEWSGYGSCVFTAQAFADLDDDAIFSTYERRGHVDENGAIVESLFVAMPHE